MTIDTTKLRELAQKATPGPWWADGDNVKCRIRCYGSDEPTQITIWRPPAVGFAISDEQNEATALFIAQLNPENILALLDERDELDRMFHDACHDLAAINFLLMTHPEKIMEEISRLKNIEAAARNMVKVKGRHHSELAMNQLLESLG